MSSPGFHFLATESGFNAALGFSGALDLPAGYALALDFTNPALMADGSGNRLTTGSTGTAVKDIYDIGNNLRASQSTAGNRATWSAEGLVTTSGPSWYTLTAAQSLVGDVTLLAAVKRTSGILIGAGALTAPNRPYVSYNTGTLSYMAGALVSAQWSNTSTAKHIQSARITASPAAVSARQNGADAGAIVNAASTSNDLVYLLRRGTDFSDAGNCLLAILVYTRLLTDTELIRSERYLARIAGITL